MITIYWSAKAEENYDDILEDLGRNWSSKIQDRFAEDVRSTIKAMERFPRIYPTFRDDEKLRKAVVNPHISLFYEIINDDEIEIICLWHNRRNPDDLPI